MLAFSLFALLPLLASAAPTTVSKRDTGVLIYAGRDGKCLTIQPGTQIINGSPVISGDCNTATRWDINRGSGSILVTGLNFALDIGLNPGNNGPLKVWQSYPTAPQQTWYYTGDNRIAQTGGTQCLDEGTNGIQTYACTTGNTNQIFFTRSPNTPPSSTSSAPPPPASSSSTPPPSGQTRFKATAYNNFCLTSQNGQQNVGTPVQLSTCFAASDPYYQLQQWTVPAVGATGPVKLGNLCLDAGNNPANGSGMKIWTCYDGLIQQTWTRNADGTFSLANGQCLDVTAESGYAPGNLYPKQKDMQTWACSNNGDPQQKFAIVGI